MEAKRIYIAGLMRGLTHEQIERKFAAKQQELEAQGLKVVNPVFYISVINAVRAGLGQQPLTETDNRKQILGTLIAELSNCDELHLLPCWQTSKGAQLERHFAQQTGIPIVYH